MTLSGNKLSSSGSQGAGQQIIAVERQMDMFVKQVIARQSVSAFIRKGLFRIREDNPWVIVF